MVEAPEPQPKAEELKAIARGQALQLVELWRACFVGGTLTRAGEQPILCDEQGNSRKSCLSLHD